MVKQNAIFSNKLTTFSFIYALFIISYHLNPSNFFAPNIIINDDFISRICYFLNQICTASGGVAVSYFFLTSSFLLYHKLSFDNLRDKYQRRVFSLLMPLMVWSFIGFLFYLIFDHKRFSNISMYKIFYDMLITLEYDGVLWFVQALLILLIFCPIILFIMRERYCGILFILIAIFNSTVVHYNSDNVSRFFAYIPIYLIGAYLGTHNYTEIINGIKIEKLLLFSGAIASFTLIITNLTVENQFINMIFYLA